MPALEVEWWRCKRDAIKKLMFKAERNLCGYVLLKSLAAAGTSSQREEQRESDWRTTAEV